MLSQELKEQVFTLPPSDRLALVTAIIKSLQDKPISATERSEAIQQMRDLLKIDSSSISAPEESIHTSEVVLESTPHKQLCRTKAFRDLLKNAPPIPTDFDPEEARWEHLKEKYEL
jgi:hypothetical protein